MADPKFPYVKWRDGRPRSSHGAYARLLGFVDGDLRHPPYDEKGRAVGAWFNLQEASDFSDKRKSEIEAARRAGKLPTKITVRKRVCLGELGSENPTPVTSAARRTIRQISSRALGSARRW